MRARAAYEEALILAEPCHDVFGLSSALIGLARIAAVDDPKGARERADQAVELDEGVRKVPALLTRGWVELISGDRHGALADASRATVAARQWRDNPGLAEAITAELTDRRLALEQCLKRLQPTQRQMLGLRYQDGSSLETVAKSLNRSIESTYKAISRLRHALFDCITRRLVGVES